MQSEAIRAEAAANTAWAQRWRYDGWTHLQYVEIENTKNDIIWAQKTSYITTA